MKTLSSLLLAILLTTGIVSHSQNAKVKTVLEPVTTNLKKSKRTIPARNVPGIALGTPIYKPHTEISLQHFCRADEVTEKHIHDHGLDQQNILFQQELKRAYGTYRKSGSRAIRNIPVVVHVVYNTPEENVSSSSIQLMLSNLNEAYSRTNPGIGNVRSQFTNDIGNPELQFCLATTDPNGNATTGITRTQTTETWFDPDTETDDMKTSPKGKDAWDPTKYLNIWICDLTSGAPGGLVTLGYAYLPSAGVHGAWYDGLVVDAEFGVGRDNDRITIHEIGHYMGLEHPWADGDCFSDDGFADTPNTDEATFDCTDPGLQRCGVLTQYENFMDYADCGVMFTNDQSNYMNFILDGVRSSLLNSNGCGAASAYCIPSYSTGPDDGDYIDDVVLGTINNTGTGVSSGTGYTDYTSMSTDLQRSNSYTLNVRSGNYDDDYYAAWIDFNQDNDFDDLGEKLGEFRTNSTFQSLSFPFSVPASAKLGTTRMRVKCVFGASGMEACGSHTYGEAEDYSVKILGSSDSLIAEFSADQTSILAGASVNFTDQSSGAPTSWSWTFNGGSPASYNGQFPPAVTYGTAGQYTVELTVSKGGNNDTETKTNYINVSDPGTCDTLLFYDSDVAIVNMTDINDFDMQFVDQDGLTPFDSASFLTEWMSFSDVIAPGDTDFYLGATSWFTNPGQADNWIVMGPLTIPATGAILEWEHSYPDPNFRDGYEVLINTTGINVADFSGATKLFTVSDNSPSTTADTNWVKQSVPISATSFGGQQVYLAFHHNAFDMSFLLLDDIFVNSCPGVCVKPTANFQTTSQGTTVTFANSSTNGTSWLWDFGDGGTSTMENPVHDYVTAGTYTACLTAANDCDTNKVCKTFSVSDTSSTCDQFLMEYEVPSIFVSAADLDDFETDFHDEDGFTPNEATYNSDWMVFQNVIAPGDTNFFLGATSWFTSPGQADNWIVFGPLSIPSGGAELTWDYYVLDNNFRDGYEIFVTDQGRTVNDFTTSGTKIFEYTDNDPQSAGDTVWTGVSANVDGATYGNKRIYLAFHHDADDQNILFIDNITMHGCSTFCAPPSAGFTHTATGLSVQFSDVSTSEDSVIWDFGDGNTSTTSDPNHTYSANGTYLVCLTVINSCDTAVSCENVDVGCSAPDARFSSLINGLGANFTDASSGADSWLWTFGDGSTSSEQNPIHVYTNPGTYTVCLSVFNSCDTSSDCSIIQVECGPPVSSFSFADTGFVVDFMEGTTNATSWLWTFGDGNSSTEANPRHTYAGAGTYTVCLTAVNGCDSVTTCKTAEINCVGSVSEFTSSVTSLVATFTNTGANGVSWAWDFGDGNSSTLENPVHTYSTSGVYTVCLATMNSCDTVVQCNAVAVDVGCTPPVPGFTFSALGEKITFTNISTDATSYIWTFGDGNNNIEQNVSHTYAEEGTYLVCLTAINGCDSATTCQSVVVSCQPPKASFLFADDGGFVSFTDLSQSTNSWFWTFGDGATSTEANPTHTYQLIGTYTVCLTAINDCDSNVTCKSVSILTFGVEDEKGYNLSVFPNPASQQVNINTDQPGEKEVFITDLLGNVVYQKQVTTGNLSIETGEFARGIYFVRVSSEYGDLLQKLLLE